MDHESRVCLVMTVPQFEGGFVDLGATVSGYSSNLANVASLLWHAYKSLPSPSKDVNWAGMDFSSPLPSSIRD